MDNSSKTIIDQSESEIEAGILLQWLQQIFAEKNGLRHDSYMQCCEHATELQVHGEGLLPIKLIRDGRPGEPAEILNYRLCIYQPFTTTEWEKARNVTMRIFQPGGFEIKWNEEIPSGISEKETLKYFTEKEFGNYYSLLNFEKDVMVQGTLVDANAIVAIVPQPSAPDEFLKPIPVIFTSDRVLFRNDFFTIAVSDEKSSVKVGNISKDEGYVGYVWTSTYIWKFKQYGKKTDLLFEFENILQHDLGYQPVRLLGGVVKAKNGISFYSSFFAGVIPHWNKAITVQSDLDGFLYRHLNPTLIRAEMPCPSCHASGKVMIGDEYSKCSDCNGSGYRGFNTKKTGSPYQDITFDIEQMGRLNLQASDLMAYVSPPVSNFQEVNNLITMHIQRGFASLNMEVVNMVGASQSGVAKAIDRQDLNSFLSEMAGHFFEQIEWLYKVIAEIRYRPLLGDRWIETLPTIIQPTKFDYVTTDSMLAEMQSAKNAETHPAIIKAMNVSAAHKFLGDNSTEAQMVQAQIKLDPYDGMSEDSILALNAAGVLEKTDLYIHANISNLVQESIKQNPDFLTLPYPDQKEIIQEIAMEKLGGQAIQTTNKLRETVGGIEGILKIAEQLNMGIIDESAAIGILTDIYNFPQERAAQIVSGFNTKRIDPIA